MKRMLRFVGALVALTVLSGGLTGCRSIKAFDRKTAAWWNYAGAQGELAEESAASEEAVEREYIGLAHDRVKRIREAEKSGGFLPATVFDRSSQAEQPSAVPAPQPPASRPGGSEPLPVPRAAFPNYSGRDVLVSIAPTRGTRTRPAISVPVKRNQTLILPDDYPQAPDLLKWGGDYVILIRPLGGYRNQPGTGRFFTLRNGNVAFIQGPDGRKFNVAGGFNIEP